MNQKILLTWLFLSFLSPDSSARVQNWEKERKPFKVRPVNRKTSAESRALLNFIYSISGKYCLAGQHDYHDIRCSEEVHEITGKYPAILGLEMNVYVTDSLGASRLRDSVMQTAIRYWEEGGIITFTWHQCKPGSTVQDFAHSQAKCSQEEFDEIITPGTKGYEILIEEFDQAAMYLKKLRDAQMPVLWRPYHEMNGGWFWWGKKNNFDKLWNIMYDRLIKHHKLNNLIWVYSPNVPINKNIDPYKSYYPDHKKVDILGTDAYPKSNDQFLKEWHDEIVELAEGRPVAQTECGVLPTPAQFSEIYNQYTWFLTWRGFLVKSNTIQQIQALYDNPRIITRDKVPDLKRN